MSGPTIAEKEVQRRRGKKPKPPGTIKVYKTAVFKIHNPSRHKRAMLRDSLKRAHLAYTRLLAHLMPDIERFAAMSKKDRNAEMQTRIYRFVRPLPLGGAAKAGIRVDVQGQINSYIELRNSQEGAQVPTAARLNKVDLAYEAALDELSTLGSNVLREGELRDEICRTSREPRVRPLSYYGNGPDFYLLLAANETGRYFVWLNLHSKSSRFAQPIDVENLVDMRSGKIVSFKSQTGALFPLELGCSYHDREFIKRGRPQSAKLVWRTERGGAPCDDFEVHITFEWLVPERQTRHWLGVDRGIYNLAAYAVSDDDGFLIEKGRISGRALRHVQRLDEARTRQLQKRGRLVRGKIRRRRWADEAVHVTANAIVQQAVKHEAQVILEDLQNLSALRRRVRVKGTRRGGFKRMLNRVQYEKLKNVLAYKLGEHGLPPPLFVNAAYTSQTCPMCGHSAKKNRLKSRIEDGIASEAFKCVECGHSAHADENAAHVIAMKGRWLTSLPRKSDRTWQTLPDKCKFEAFVKECAERRKGVQRPES